MTLFEEEGHSDGFEHYYRRVRLYDSIALVIGSLLSGVVGKLFSPRLTFWLTIPFVALSIVALLKFKEPKLHKTSEKTSLIKHSIETFAAVFRSREVLLIVAALMLFTMAERIVFELFGLWFLAFALPVFFWGPATALLQSSIGLSGPLATRVKRDRSKLLVMALGLCAASFVLVWKGSVAAVIFAQAILLAGFGTCMILLNHRVHDALPSRVRAGSSSAIGTLSQIIILPVFYAFGWLSDTHTVFVPAWIVVVTVVLAVWMFYVMVIQHIKNTTITARDLAESNEYPR